MKKGILNGNYIGKLDQQETGDRRKNVGVEYMIKIWIYQANKRIKLGIC